MTITTPTLAAITTPMADTLAAATCVSATSPDSSDGPRCFRATTAPKLRCVDRIADDAVVKAVGAFVIVRAQLSDLAVSLPSCRECMGSLGT